MVSTKTVQNPDEIREAAENSREVLHAIQRHSVNAFQVLDGRLNAAAMVAIQEGLEGLCAKGCDIQAARAGMTGLTLRPMVSPWDCARQEAGLKEAKLAFARAAHKLSHLVRPHPPLRHIVEAVRDASGSSLEEYIGIDTPERREALAEKFIVDAAKKRMRR